MPSPLDLLMKPSRPGRVAGLQRSTDPDNSVFLTTVKSHLKLSGTAEDTLLQLYIDGAVEYIELVSRRSLLDQAWTLTLDELPACDRLELYMGPVKAVTTFTTYDLSNNVDTTFADYVVDTAGDRLLLNSGYTWPVNLRRSAAAVIVYTTGHGATLASLPPVFIQAVLMLVGYFHVNRDVSCTVDPAMAGDIATLLNTKRRWRL